MEEVFPRAVSCTIDYFGPVERDQAQLLCMLPNNDYNQLIFLFEWIYLFLILLPINVMYFMYILTQSLCPSLRQQK